MIKNSKWYFVTSLQIFCGLILIFTLIIGAYFLFNKNKDLNRITEVGNVNRSFGYVRFYETYIFTGCDIESDLMWISTDQIVVGVSDEKLDLSYDCDFNTISYIDQKDDFKTSYSAVSLEQGIKDVEVTVEFWLPNIEGVEELEITDKLISLVNDN